MQEVYVMDFRLWPMESFWEPYHVSDNIERVHIRNLSDWNTELHVRQRSITLAAQEVTVVEQEFLQGAEGLFSPDCYNGKSLWSDKEKDRS